MADHAAARAGAQPVRDLLVVELLGGIGDLLLALPAVHALAASHPRARVRVVTVAAAAPLLARDPAVAEVVAVEDLSADGVAAAVRGALAHRRPDLAVTTTRHSGVPALLASGAGRAVTDLWRSPPPDQLVDERFLALLVADGVVTPEHGRTPLRLALDDAEVTAAAAVLPADQGPVLLLPDAGMPVKRWPTDRWTALARRLLADGVPVVVATADVASAERVAGPAGAAVLPPGPLRSLAAACAAAGRRGGVVVGGDTGPLRLAMAAGAPVVGVFGPTLAVRYGPRPAQGVGLQGLPGCEVRRPTAITEQECWWSGRCPLTAGTRADGRPACLDDVAVADVHAAVVRRRAPAAGGSSGSAAGTVGA